MCWPIARGHVPSGNTTDWCWREVLWQLQLHTSFEIVWFLIADYFYIYSGTSGYKLSAWNGIPILNLPSIDCGSFSFAFICLLIVVKCTKRELDWCNFHVLIRYLLLYVMFHKNLKLFHSLPELKPSLCQTFRYNFCCI